MWAATALSWRWEERFMHSIIEARYRSLAFSNLWWAAAEEIRAIQRSYHEEWCWRLTQWIQNGVLLTLPDCENIDKLADSAGQALSEYLLDDKHAIFSMHLPNGATVHAGRLVVPYLFV